MKLSRIVAMMNERTGVAPAVVEARIDVFVIDVAADDFIRDFATLSIVFDVFGKHRRRCFGAQQCEQSRVELELHCCC